MNMSRKHFTRNYFDKKKTNTKFVPQQEWVQSSTRNTNTYNKSLKLTNSNFPSIAGSVSIKENDCKIKYDLKRLFNKKKHQKKKTIRPGWIKLYYKNNVRCTAYGPEVEYCYESETKFQEDLIQKMINRHELYEYLDELNRYIPYWKIEHHIPEESLDYYPGDTESEEEYYELEETDEDSDYDN